MNEAALTALRYGLPPLVGAMIGYVTNYIAIRMLFRPLREKRVFGLRIPLTPGIIPRRRWELAESIGRMVSSRLLTEDAIRRQLAREDFQEGLRAQIARLTSSVFTPGDAGGAANGIGRAEAAEAAGAAEATEAAEAAGAAGAAEAAEAAGAARSAGAAGAAGTAETGGEDATTDGKTLPTTETQILDDELMTVAQGILESFFRSERFEELVRVVARHVVAGLTKIRVEQLVPDRDRAARALEEIARDLIAGPLSKSVHHIVEEWITDQMERNVWLREYLSDELVETVEQVLYQAYDPLFEHFVSWLRTPDVRQELSYRGRIILRDVLDRLNVLQRFIVSAAKYDQALGDRMPEIVDDFVETVDRSGRVPANKRRVVRLAVDGLRRLQDSGFADAAERLRIDPVDYARQGVDQVFRILSSERVQRGVFDTVSRFLEQNSGKTLGELLEQITGWDEERLVQHALDVLREWLERPGSAEGLSEQVVKGIGDFLQRVRREGLRAMVSIQPQHKAALDDFVTRKAVQALDAKLPDFVVAFDIHGLVVAKVNSLDVMDVERLLMMVISRHLKWINLFGAFLGAGIGAVQVLINILTAG